MKCSSMSRGLGALLLYLFLCWPAGAAETGGRVTEPKVDLVPVVDKGLQSPLYLTMQAMDQGNFLSSSSLARFGSSYRASFRISRFSTSRVEYCREGSVGCSVWLFTRSTGRTADFS